MGNIIVLDDVKKNYENYLSNENAATGNLLKYITNIFMECSSHNENELPSLNEIEMEIVNSMKVLSATDIESFYWYVVKKLNDFKSEIECILPCIPDDKTTEFTKKINRYLKRKNVINDVVLKDLIASDKSDSMTKFKVYYIMFTFHHDKKNVHQCKEIVNTYEDYFSSYPLWHYTKSQMLYQEEREKDTPNMADAIKAAKKCITIYEDDSNDYDSNYPGIYHNLCELVFNAYDLGDKNSLLENLEFAKYCIENAIRINRRFAKYYYTKGRLLLAESVATGSDLYDEAERYILKAIDKEDSSNDNYALKIVDYETALLRCKTERKIRDIDVTLENAKKTQEETKNLQAETKTLFEQSATDFQEQLKNNEDTFKNELENQKKETLEVLGFFSGIISLIVVTAQVVLNLDMISASVIMLLFLGTMIIAFSFFHFVVLNGERKKAGLIVGYIIVGIILIATALGIAFYHIENSKLVKENSSVINEIETKSSN